MVAAPRWHQTLLVTVGVALAGGCPAPRPVPPAARHRPPPAPPPEAPPGYQARAGRVAPHPGAVALQLIGRGALSFVVSADGQSQLLLRGYGGVVRQPGQPELPLPRRHYVWSGFAPAGDQLAVADERHRIEVLALPGGRRIAVVDGAENPRWIGGDAIGFRRGCEGWRIQPAAGGPERIGAVPGPCGELIHGSADFGTWVLAEPAATRRGAMTTYRLLRQVDLTGGGEQVLFSGSDDEAVMAPRVAPDGGRVCWLDPGSALRCRGRDGEVEQIAPQATTPIEFDDSGRRLLYATGDRDSGQVAVVDFDSKQVTALPRDGRQWWVFLPGGRRIAGHGGRSSGLVYDLAGGWRADIGEPGTEWEGLWTLPGDPTRLVIGRERGGTRDLFLAVLPD